MLKIASGVKSNHAGTAHSTFHAAHFDIAVVSATGYDGASGRIADPVNLFVEGLTNINKKTALLHCAHFGATGSVPSAQSPRIARQAILQKVICRRSPSRFNGGEIRQFHSTPDNVFFTAAKLLCIHDRIFNLGGGSEFVRASVSTARRAGRSTAIFCTDLQTAFDKRQEIFDSFGGALDFVVGEPSTVLALSGLRRIDSLILRMIHVRTGLVLHRVDYPSIFIRPAGNAVEVDDDRISRVAFWTDFVPRAFAAFLQPGSRTPRTMLDRMAGT